jgi:phenylalanine-4-hydroxylase
MARATVEVGDDFTIMQNWDAYTAEEHGVWRTLFERQTDLLTDRAAPEYLAGLKALRVSADHIPDFRQLNDILDKATGWRIVAVPGLVPDEIFFGHLAQRRFPSTCFIRTPEQMDYLEEPDIFHDVFGHVPLLVNPIFADYMQAYGQGGLKALGMASLQYLARLYWYTVEFGLIATNRGLRVYGAGVLSSVGETHYALTSPLPQRLAFDLKRVLRTPYKIDDYQSAYFVVESFGQLFDATAPDFSPLYAEIADQPALPLDSTLHDERTYPPNAGKVVVA